MEKRLTSVFTIALTIILAFFISQCSLLEDDPEDETNNPINTTDDNNIDNINDNDETGTDTSTHAIIPAIDPDSGINGPDAPVNPIDSTVMNDESSIMGVVDPSTALVIPISPYEGDPDGDQTVMGSDPISDGSAARLAAHGTVQYFYGLLSDNGQPVPIVKIINSVTDDVIDVAVIFSPDFTDNTYGSGKIGWGNRRFEHLVTSDHVELQFLDASGSVVLHAKFDLISVAPDAVSGYASLGLKGDGELLAGDASDILSFGTSIDDNLNYFGYNGPEIFEGSPETDSVFTPNPSCPNWQYYVVYHVSLDPDAFGSAGYGSVQMTTVHASPAKSTNETIEVTPDDGPAPGTPQDPFRYFTPVTPDTTTIVPPDTTTSPDTSEVPM